LIFGKISKKRIALKLERGHPCRPTFEALRRTHTPQYFWPSWLRNNAIQRFAWMAGRQRCLRSDFTILLFL